MTKASLKNDINEAINWIDIICFLSKNRGIFSYENAQDEEQEILKKSAANANLKLEALEQKLPSCPQNQKLHKIRMRLIEISVGIFCAIPSENSEKFDEKKQENEIENLKNFIKELEKIAENC